MGFTEFSLKVATFREQNLVPCVAGFKGKVLQTLLRAPMGREKCSQEWLTCFWESNQRNNSFFGNGWALGLLMRGQSSGRKPKG